MSVALAIAVALLVFNRPPTGGQNVQAQLEAESKGRSLAEAELEKRRRDLEEHKAQLSEVKDQLKQTKKKLFDQREADKDGQDLVKARTEVERSASLQLESVRAELSSTITELQRLRAERDLGGRPRREPRPA
ncbi:MAG: cell envelope biogenesis protein TolA, partial [Myxococcota bacterium]|nr:cell envelope biogenesis protein TolA [Myxococcota bacterium]